MLHNRATPSRAIVSVLGMFGAALVITKALLLGVSANAQTVITGAIITMSYQDSYDKIDDEGPIYEDYGGEE